MTQKVLLVEDSKEVYQMVKNALASTTIDLNWVDNISEAKKELNEKDYELALLDIELPDGSGLELCSDILNEHPSLSIFFLTASSSLSEKVLGFSAGAEDYITKPFNNLELKARIEAKLNKIKILKSSNDIMEWEELRINKSTQEVFLKYEGKEEPTDLTALEFKLLLYFADRAHEVIDRDTILNDIWGEDIHVYSRSVDTHVSKLRKKLGEVSKILESVHGAGYKFNPN